jgi:hypothetical protein
MSVANDCSYKDQGDRWRVMQSLCVRQPPMRIGYCLILQLQLIETSYNHSGLV